MASAQQAAQQLQEMISVCAAQKETSQEQFAQLSAGLGLFATQLNFQVTSLAAANLQATAQLIAEHTQPFGNVHGGVLAALVETAGSVLGIAATGRPVAGQSNHTEFLQAVTPGEVTVTAQVLHAGKSTVVVQVVISQHGRNCATGIFRGFVFN